MKNFGNISGIRERILEVYKSVVYTPWAQRRATSSTETVAYSNAVEGSLTVYSVL